MLAGVVVGAALAAVLPAWGAPPSSPGSAPGVTVKRPQTPRPKVRGFRCDGRYRGYNCTHTLYMNLCKHWIRIEWNALRLPGNTDWARTHRNWCSITWNAREAVEERKYEPEKCERLMRLMASALQGFPEVKWQDSQCTHIDAPDGVLYTTERWDRPESPDHFTEPSKHKDPDPVAIRLEDVSACTLHDDKRRVVRCPVLTQRVHSWLRKFLAHLDVHLVIQNELK